MKERIEGFLAELDEALEKGANGEILTLYPIGRPALVWKYNYSATTQDFDILRPHGGERLVKLALQRFGKDTPNARKHSIYLEVVDEGLPPVPAGYEKRATLVDGPWKNLRIYHLDPHDLAATKLRRFSSKDRADVRLLCDLGHLNLERLEQVLEKAFIFNREKDGDEFRDSAFRNLRIVQSYLRGEINEF